MIPNWKKKQWTVDVKGGPNKRSFEISVIKTGNSHGKASYGWFDQEKVLISHNGGPCHWPLVPIVWNKMLKLAQEVADELNKSDDEKIAKELKHQEEGLGFQ
jgi:hypothetical protein